MLIDIPFSTETFDLLYASMHTMLPALQASSHPPLPSPHDRYRTTHRPAWQGGSLSFGHTVLIHVMRSKG